MIEQAVLGLGSNQGEREALLAEAVQQLGQAGGVELVGASSVYLTPPHRVPGEQEDYLNQVVVADVTIPAEELLVISQAIELALGRPPDHPWGAPRTMDIDLIACGARLCDTADLVLPHPRYAERRFVLVPLAEVLPTFRDPRTGRSIRQLLADCPDGAQLRRWGVPSVAD